MTGMLLGLAFNRLLFKFPLLEALFEFRVVEIAAFAVADNPEPDPPPPTPSPPLYIFPPTTP